MKQLFLIATLGVLLICGCAKPTGTSQETGSDELPPQEINSNTFIGISMEGGGFYGGVNPVTENKKVIENDGRILIRYRQLYTGDRSRILFTSRAEVEKLASFIRDNGFFGMSDVYDCTESDGKCQDRKNHYPPAVPLTIDVAIGNSRKQVTVTIFKMGMVDYPDKLEAIVSEIDEVINQARE